MASSLTYRRLRAPRHDGGLLLDPSWRDCLELPANNRRFVDSYNFQLCGRSFQMLRQTARAELFELASSYTGQYADLSAPANEVPIVMSGHQPQLVHPGVWAKNFAIHRIAEELDGTAVQVIVDNDLMRSHALQIPTGSIDAPRVVTELFDHFAPPQPYETRYVADQAMFESFAERVTDRIKPTLGEDPLVRRIWPDVLSATVAGLPIGHAFARGRHKLELAWGLNTIEVPLSDLCETRPFRWFVLDLLFRGEEVRSCYNHRLAEYRNVHRLRSTAQPLPDLRARENWLETPFWYWTTGNPIREPLWCRRQGTKLLIGSPNGPNWTLTDTARSPDDAEEHLAGLSANGLKVRPRALTTTLYARLFLCDVFVHGIGGAKYDQITDFLASDLYAAATPGFITLSYTSLLPVEFEQVSKAQIGEKMQELRKMYFHPERFLDGEQSDDHQVSNCVLRKRKWIEHDPPKDQRKLRHEQIAAANAILRGFLQEKRQIKEKSITELRDRELASQIWLNREWSFVLFPELFLKNRLLDLRFDST